VPSRIKKQSSIKPRKQAATPALKDQLQLALAELKRKSTQRDRDNLKRFAIHAPKSFGVSMTNMKQIAKRLGRSHDLAAALWATGWYEARMLATLVDEPALVTPVQMDRWCRDFDNWAICDTAAFCLFDRTPHAWPKVAKWARRTDEFGKRAAFALLWSLTVHDKTSGDAPFHKSLPLIERAAKDDRNFVKKAVNMALRAIGKRTRPLHAAAVKLSKHLAASPDATARWIGKDALRELTSPAVTRRLAAKK
jgi:3-methyladenine DNA glycosylase AlkD